MPEKNSLREPMCRFWTAEELHDTLKKYSNKIPSMKTSHLNPSAARVAPQDYLRGVNEYIRTTDLKTLNLNMRFFVYGPNLIKNYKIGVMSGISGTTAAWWALRGAAGYYGVQAAPFVEKAGAAASAGLAAGKVLGAAAAGFAVGVSLDRFQESIFGESYTALGVKKFVEQPNVWGSAEALPTQVVDAWDKYFSWTNVPDKAMGWLKRKLG